MCAAHTCYYSPADVFDDETNAVDVAAAREKATLERRLHKLESDYQQLEAEHREKTLQLNKLSQGKAPTMDKSKCSK